MRKKNQRRKKNLRSELLRAGLKIDGKRRAAGEREEDDRTLLRRIADGDIKVIDAREPEP
jgi:hypothetical protein